MDKLLTEIQVSDSLQVSLACLRRWRLRGEGPQYIKVGPLVRYRPQDLDDWIAALPSGGNGYRFPVQEPKGGQTGCFRLDAVLNIATGDLNPRNKLMIGKRGENDPIHRKRCPDLLCLRRPEARIPVGLTREGTVQRRISDADMCGHSGVQRMSENCL
jgi:hypothetical protein